MFFNKKLNPIVTELFIRGRKLNISQYFLISLNLIVLYQKNIRLNSGHYFIMKIPNKRELQQIAFNHSPDIDFQDYMNFYKKILQNRILFCCLIVFLHEIIYYILERIS